MQGCPPTWSKVTKRQGNIDNPLSEETIGLFRDWDYQKKTLKAKENQILVASSTEYQANELLNRGLTFPEAGPRKKLYYPGEDALNVGILVSGGIAPELIP